MKSLSYLELHILVLNSFLVKGQRCLNYTIKFVFLGRDRLTSNFEILRQSKIATASTSAV
ncbi:hypothetical protein CFP56_019331 [Quercus suber]|uniref:Uncharacterized protein n=1 Tax=Quercus suber TaxID=58331 RepID=A0AAW0KKU8_QUESU